MRLDDWSEESACVEQVEVAGASWQVVIRAMGDSFVTAYWSSKEEAVAHARMLNDALFSGLPVCKRLKVSP